MTRRRFHGRGWIIMIVAGGGGILSMVWYILTARRLFQLGTSEKKAPSQ